MSVGQFSQDTMHQFRNQFLYGSNLWSVNETFRKTLVNPLNETFLVCTHSFQECKLSRFTLFANPILGMCYRFHPDIKMTEIGSINGLRLDLFLEPSTQSNYFTEGRGIRVMIHNKSDNPRITDGFDLNVNERTNIQVDRVFNKQLPLPYNDCIKDSEDYDSELLKIVRKTSRYTQRHCFEYCFQTIAIQNCSCYTPGFYDFGYPIPCSTFDQISCQTEAWGVIFNDTNKYCSKDICPLECDSDELSLTMSTSSFPTDYYANQILEKSFVKTKYPNLSLNELKQSLVSIRVFYNRLQYTEITQDSKYNVFDFFSSIGGSVGLMIGASVLSFLEIFEFVITSFYIAYKTLTNRMEAKVKPKMKEKNGDWDEDQIESNQQTENP